MKKYMNGDLIPLDLVRDYPVKWDMEKIMIDLIQNFYDACGTEHFFDEFQYAYDPVKTQLRLWTKGHPFSYEWLTLIGGSTKRDKEEFIGMYGEGFKVCALCLCRNYHATVKMRSSNWQLETAFYKKKIEGQEQVMLGFYYYDHEDDGITELEITNVPETRLNAEHVREGMLNFYYPQNPLIGEKIVDTPNQTIYERSDVEIPNTNHREYNGVVFLKNLARARVSFPYVFVGRNLGFEDSRERKVIQPYRASVLCYEMLDDLGSEDSFRMLIRLKDHWCDKHKERSWFVIPYYVICSLVRHMAKDQNVVRKFLEMYPEPMYYMERKDSDPSRNRLRDEAEIWRKSQDQYKNIKLVNPIFRLIGAVSIVEEYIVSKDKQFLEPDGMNKEKCRLLEIMIKVILKPIGIDGIKILLSAENMPVDAMQFATRDYASKVAFKRYKIDKIVLTSSDLENYDTAVVAAIDACCHSYGKTQSDIINTVLTTTAEILLRSGDILDRFRACWIRIENGEKIEEIFSEFCNEAS